jgi:uncharacterized protein
MNIRSSLCALLAGLLWFAAAVHATDVPAPDHTWRDGRPDGVLRAADYSGVHRVSQYVQMRDGVRIAVDVWLPDSLPPSTRLPAILEQTRYYRTSILRSDLHGECRPAGKPAIDLFVTHGYAYVVVDVRGTGASFGTRTAEYSDEEIADGRDILDWIVRQDWSNGKVGSQGQSYLGTAAELLVQNHHPALKAIVPTFSGYDFYGEIVSPGGIRNTAFGQFWSDAIQALDSGAPPAPSPVLGPCPVDDDENQVLLHAAVEQHRSNFNVWRFLQQVSFRDDRFEGVNLDAGSPFTHQGSIGGERVPTYVVVGWNDSAYTLGALRRYLTAPAANMHVLIGPWGHGARYYYAPGIREPTASSFDLAAEKLRYFDYVLKGTDAGVANSPRIRYFTTGSSRWHGAQQWPPPESRRHLFYFADDRGLTEHAPRRAASDRYHSEGTAASGGDNRWHSTMGAFPVAYPDRRDMDEGLLTYTSRPLETDLEITGDPAATLFMTTDRTDTDVFVYLEEVTSDGQANYVGEGELRASHRRRGALPFRTPEPVHTDRRVDQERVVPHQRMTLEIGLLPLSHVFRAGSRLRVSIASADRSQFLEHAVEAENWTVSRGPMTPSRIELPVVERRLEP